MMLKLVIVSACILLAHLDAREVSSIKRSSDDALQKRGFDVEKFNGIANNVVPVMKGITDALGKDGFNVQRFANLVGSLGPALGVIGPLVSLATSILSAILGGGDSPELAYMKKQFGKLFRELDYLDGRLTDVANVVEKVAIYQAYKANYDKLRKIDLMFKRFSKNPEKSTEADLRNECLNHNPKHALDWIHSRVVNPRLEPQLLPTILKGTEYDIKKVDNWLKIIIADAFQASILDQACLGVSVPKPSDSVMKNDAATSKRKLDEITRKLGEYQNKLKAEFITAGYFQRDVEQVMRQGGDKNTRATNLFNKLANKYNFLYWSALVYEDVSGFNRHTIYSGNDKYTSYPGIWMKFRWYDVNLQIAWAPKTKTFNPSKYSYSNVCGAVGSESNAESANKKIQRSFQSRGIAWSALSTMQKLQWNIHYHTNGFLTLQRCSKIYAFILHN